MFVWKKVNKTHMGLPTKKLALLHANNKGADQPAHLRSLTSTFVICFLESIIAKLATCKISILYLVPVAEQAWLSLTWSDILKTGLLVTRPIWAISWDFVLISHIHDLSLNMHEWLSSGITAWAIMIMVSLWWETVELALACMVFHDNVMAGKRDSSKMN